VTIYFDPKRDLTDADSFVDGGLAALNELLMEVFGDRLYRADVLGDAAWPSIDEVAGRVISVLSGNLSSRRGYVADGGHEPALGLDDGGRVVEVHTSGTGQLWYWSGRRTGDRITWRRHGKIGPGRSAAVAVGDAGTAVLIHRGGDALWRRVGRVDHGTSEIDWSAPSRKAAPAAATRPFPTVRWLDGQRLRVVYDVGAGRLAREGTLDGDGVRWKSAPEPARASDAGWSASHARNTAGWISVTAVPHPRGDGTQLLRYATERLDDAVIAYEQLLFVEGQWTPEDGEADVAHGKRFVATAAAAGAARQTRTWRQNGKVVRLWKFSAEQTTMSVPPNFPATDHPYDDWYRDFCDKHGAA
jgi:hypothetical protein